MAFNIAAFLVAPLVGLLMLIVHARARGRWRKPLLWSALGCIAFPVLSLLIPLVGAPLQFLTCESDCASFESTVNAAMHTTTIAAVMSLVAAMGFLTLVIAREPS